MNCAPAATFFASRWARNSRGRAKGFSAAPSNTLRRVGQLPSAQEAVLVAHRPRGLEQRQRVEVEHRQRLRMIAGLHTVPRQAENVTNAHRGPAENVALDGNAVLVAAGDLHHRGVADPRQEGADGEARHVAVGAAAVGGVDGIDITVEDTRAPVHLLGVRGVGRRHLRRHCELPGAQDALETPGGGVTRQDRQRIPGHRLVLEDQARSPARSRCHAQPGGFPGQPPVHRMLYAG